MKQLVVTWQDGPWIGKGDPPVSSVVVPAHAAIVSVGEETLVFKHPASGGEIYLALPSTRLISVVQKEVPDA